MTEVRGRAQPLSDRAGDPLDGLVNMFDLGVVLAVAFLIAGLGLSQLAAKRSAASSSHAGSITVSQHEKLVPLKPGDRRVRVGAGAASVGQVYRLPNGELVYVARR